MTYRAFVAFSGGGAKGIVHVGALKALEDRHVEFVGFSGTSAGSIVACLAAAGFKASDLVDTHSGRTILDRLTQIDDRLKRATDLFGRDGWARIRLFRGLVRLPVSLHHVLLFLWLLPAVTGAILWFIPSTVFFYLSAAIWLVLCSTVAIAYRSLMGGMANLGQFRDALSILLQQQIYPNEVGRVVTMADFGIDGRPSLKIVSANLTTRRLHLFSKERTPETPAADAVAASICLPVIFEPWSIGREFHVDGGLVSNLPAWPFDEERELDPAALTVAIEIEDQELKSSKKPFAWLPAAVRTTLSGSAELNVRISGPAVQLALPTRLDLLDFDVDIATVCKEVDEVAAATALRLDKRLFRLPEIYRNACLVAQAVATDALGIAPNGKLDEPRVRVAVGRLERNYSRSLRLSYSAGFDDDADESMLIPLDGSFAGAAWADRQSILEVAPFEVTKDLPGPANRMRRKSRPANLAWVMCIPILDEVTGQSRLLVQLDGNWNLPQDSETEAALSSVEEAVKDFFRLVLHELRDLEEANGL